METHPGCREQRCQHAGKCHTPPRASAPNMGAQTGQRKDGEWEETILLERAKGGSKTMRNGLQSIKGVPSWKASPMLQLEREDRIQGH